MFFELGFHKTSMVRLKKKKTSMVGQIASKGWRPESTSTSRRVLVKLSFVKKDSLDLG